MPTSDSKPAETASTAPAAAAVSDEKVKYTLVIPVIPLGSYNPGQLAWIEEAQAAEYIAAGFATKVLRKDAPDVAPPA